MASPSTSSEVFHALPVSKPSRARTVTAFASFTNGSCSTNSYRRRTSAMNFVSPIAPVTGCTPSAKTQDPATSDAAHAAIRTNPLSPIRTDMKSPCASGRHRRRVFVFFEELQQFVAVLVIPRVLQQIAARARPRQIHLHHATNPRMRSIGHHDHAVGEQDGLIHVVRDTDRRHLAALPDIHENLLQLPARQRIQHAEGFV